MSKQLVGEYRVYLTREHEYHVEGHVCCGVRERSNGEWLQAHWALAQHLTTAFADGAGRLFSIRPPVVGERLCFRPQGEEHYTSPVLSVEQLRPYCDLPQELTRLAPALRERLLLGDADRLRETA
jgi:hypothetical protein